MEIEATEEMIEAAIKKAVELKMIPKWAGMEDYLSNRDAIQQIIYAAIEVWNRREA